MIINHSRGFIFVHVPKSAGTSVSGMLEKYSSYMDIEIGGTALGEQIQPGFKRRHGLAKHSTATEVRAVMGDDRFDAYYSFAIVRNPYTRAFSTFNWLHRQRDREQPLSQRTLKKIEGLGQDFGAFVRSEYFKTEGEDRVLRPQRFWVHLAGGAQLSFIGSVENIDADMAKIVQSINLHKLDPCAKSPEVPPAIKRNESTEEPDKLWNLLRADPELERLIHARYKADFELFGYRRFNPAVAEAYDPSRRAKPAGKPVPAGKKKASA